jgi:hypothetical protein
MQPTARLETLLNDPRTTMKLHALIADLRRGVQLLECDLYEEEKRTGIFNVSNAAYDPCPRSESQAQQSLGYHCDAAEPVGRSGCLN